MEEKEQEVYGHIYKIVNPEDKIYIGATVDFNRRLRQYKYTNAKNQRLLKESFEQHGKFNHVWEVIERCYSREELLETEVYYVNFFKTNGHKYPEIGLNCNDGGRGFGAKRAHTEEHKLKISKTLTGKKPSDETKRKMSETHKGKIISEETRRKMGEAHKGKIISEEQRLQISKAQTGRKHSEEHTAKTAYANSKDIIDTATGQIYRGVKEAAEAHGLNHNTLKARLNGRLKNKTTLRYVE